MSSGSGTRWSANEMMLLYKLKMAGKSYAEISEILETTEGKRPYTENSCKKKWNDTDWESMIAEIESMQDRFNNLEEEEAEKHRIISATIENHNKRIKREKGRTDLIIDGLKSAIYRLPKPKSSDINYSPSNQKKFTSEHMGLMLSDLHIGAEYSKTDTGGLSEFNLDVYRKRINNLTNSIVRIKERHELMYDLPELHIFCLGDIVAGMANAGAWSMNYINMDIYDQMMEGVSSIRDMMAKLSHVFPKINFYGVYGNHGRVGRSGDQKVSTNWDKICYEFLRLSLSEYDNISWNIPVTWFIQEDILGHNFFLTHGDGIRGSMGIPHYGVQRAEKNISGMMETRPDYFLIGHFHTSAEMQTNSSKILMNGSFMGGDMYSLKDLSSCDRPEQKLFGIHNKHGVTWTYNIHLDAED